MRNGNNSPFKPLDNNNFYTSTPAYKNANGNVSNLSLDATNANYSVTARIDESPARNYEKEQIMNSING